MLQKPLEEISSHAHKFFALCTKIARSRNTGGFGQSSSLLRQGMQVHQVVLRGSHGSLVVTLMQLRFTSFTVTSLRRDSHP